MGSGLVTQMSRCITGSPDARRERSLNPEEASWAMSSQLALFEAVPMRATDIMNGRWLAAATKLSCSSTPMKKGLAPMASAIVVTEETAALSALTLGTIQ